MSLPKDEQLKGAGHGMKGCKPTVWIGVAIMLVTTLVAIFVINPEATGYIKPVAVYYEATGLILGGVLAAYLGIIWKSST